MKHKDIPELRVLCVARVTGPQAKNLRRFTPMRVSKGLPEAQQSSRYEAHGGRCTTGLLVASRVKNRSNEVHVDVQRHPVGHSTDGAS